MRHRGGRNIHAHTGQNEASGPGRRHAGGAKSGYDHAALKVLAADMFQVESLTELSLVQLRALYEAIPDAQKEAANG